MKYCMRLFILTERNNIFYFYMSRHNHLSLMLKRRINGHNISIHGLNVHEIFHGQFFFFIKKLYPKVVQECPQIGSINIHIIISVMYLGVLETCLENVASISDNCRTSIHESSRHQHISVCATWIMQMPCRHCKLCHCFSWHSAYRSCIWISYLYNRVLGQVMTWGLLWECIMGRRNKESLGFRDWSAVCDF